LQFAVFDQDIACFSTAYPWRICPLLALSLNHLFQQELGRRLECFHFVGRMLEHASGKVMAFETLGAC
jgi:hypothetical protein